MNEGEQFARRWIDGWNSMELDRALALWSDDLTFWSPLAAEITGSPVLRGKTEVAAYWGKALAKAGLLRFRLKAALWDADARTVTIVYRRERAGKTSLACEVVQLDANGVAVHGMAFQGAPLP